jgi:hypothetical protein
MIASVVGVVNNNTGKKINKPPCIFLFLAVVEYKTKHIK